LAGAFILAIGAIALFLAWLFGTQGGLQWALDLARKESGGAFVVEGASGTLAGGMALERVQITGPTGIDARRLSARLHLAALLGARVVIEPLRIDALEVALHPTRPGGTAPPALPFGLGIGDAAIGTLGVTSGGTRYELRDLRIASFSLGAGPGTPISAEAAFGVALPPGPLGVKLSLAGNLAHLQMHAGLQLAAALADVRAVLATSPAARFESLQAKATGIDLARFDAGWPHTQLELSLAGQGNAQRLSGEVSAANALSGPIDRERVPIARVAGRFVVEELESVGFEHARIELPGGGLLEGNASASAAGIEGELQATRLDLRALYSTLRATRLSGPVELRLARDVQTLRGTLSEAGLSVSAEAVRRGNVVDVRALRATAQGGGEVSGAGRLRLGDPLGVDARLALHEFNPAAFGDYPEGAISGSLAASGELGSQRALDLTWTFAESTLLGEPFASRGQARVIGQRLAQGDAEATLGSTRATARGGFGRAEDELTWSVTAPKLEERMAQISGRLQANGTLSGTWSEPRAAITARFDSVVLPHGVKLERATADIAGTPGRHEGRFTARVEESDVLAVLRGGLDAERRWSGEILSLDASGKLSLALREPVPLKVSRGRLELGRVRAAARGGSIVVNELTWSAARFSTSGELSGLPTQWLVDAGALGDKLRSTLTVDGQWSVTAAPDLDGTLRLRRAGGDLVVLGERPLELGLQSVVLDARFTNAGVGARLDVASRLATAALGAQLGRVKEGGALGLGPDSPLLVQGQLELANARLIAQPLVPDARIDGRVGVDLEASGTLGKPVFAGAVRGDALLFELPLYGVYLEKGELRARIAEERLTVERFSIEGGAGSFTASGSLPLRLAEGDAKLTWQAHSFGLLERPDMRLIASGQGEAGFDGKRLSLSGELRADRGHVDIERERIPKLGDDVVVQGVRPRVPGDKAPLPIALNIDFDLGPNLTVQGQGLDGKLTGRVNLSTTKDGELRAYGRVETVYATYYAYGQNLVVDPGVLIFDGPLDNPAVQITAWRRKQAVEAGVQFSGTLRALRVQLVSQPPVSESEALSWLVLGRGPADVTKADLGLLQAAAGALLARGDSMPLDRRIARSFGLDEISFRGSGEAQDRALAFGKRLSDRVYVSYEQGLGVVASNLVKIDYSLSRRWSLRAETGTASGGGIFYRFSW